MTRNIQEVLGVADKLDQYWVLYSSSSGLGGKLGDGSRLSISPERMKTSSTKG
ncbi:OLC1v1005449C1 [Oldenlandia corymbosa var. corymbosa]|uniref:OLC1v1005449C1 n=1 Tax=Oldenlandia corymbosa var. corymbosa TaxID=529605 RepID=A0AAV1DEM9_OLDCO|nr:OLC1v1005449C1 [Oldenlandia corymbosa var. corymbosa]